MSNSIEKNILEYVYSENFIKKISQENLTAHSFNALLMVHMMAIAYKTTSIRDCGFIFSYYQDASDILNPFLPKMGFYLFTSKNALIEETSRCSVSRGNFENNYFQCNLSRNFRKCFVDYFEKFAKKIYPLNFSSYKYDYDYEADIVRLSDTKADFQSYGKKNTEDSIRLFYEKIIGYHPKIKSYIEKLYLTEHLEVKNSNEKVKIKI